MGDEFALVRKTTRLAGYVLVGKLFSYLVAIVGNILIIRLLGPNDFGLLSIAFFLPSLLIIAGDLGVDQATIRFMAESKGNERSFLYTAISFDVLLGILLFFTGVGISQFVSTHLFAKPEVASLAVIASFQALSFTVYNIIYASFVVLDPTKVPFTLLSYNVIQFGMAIVLLLSGFGVQGATIAFAVSPLVSAAVMSIFLLRRVSLCKPRLTVLRKLLSFGVPFTGGVVLSSSLTHFLNFLISRFDSATNIGNYFAGARVGVIYELLTTPVGIAMFPAFSQLDPGPDSSKIQKGFEYAVRFLTMIVAPLSFVLIILSDQLVKVLYGEAYLEAPLYLQLYTLFFLYIMGERMLKTLLTGMGDTRSFLRFSVIELTVGVVIGSALIPIYGVIGRQVAVLIIYWPGYVLMARHVGKSWGVKVPIQRMLKTYPVAGISCLPALIIAFLPLDDLTKVVLSIVVVLPLYLLTLVKARVLDRNDTIVLENSLGTLPYVGRPIRRLVRVMNYLM